MTSTTILYMRYDPFEYAELKRVTEEAENRSIEASHPNYEGNDRPLRHYRATKLRNLLNRYEGSLKAVGK